MLSFSRILRRLQGVNVASGGVYSTADLAVLLERPHPVQVSKTVRRLVADGTLLRIRRGLYADGLNGYRPELVGQRWLTPSYLSTETALDRHGLCETGVLAFTYVTTRLIPARKQATRRLQQHQFVYRHLARHLFFGYEAREGVLLAQPEKAALDLLYFLYKGQRSVLSPADVAFARLNRSLYEKHLRAFRQAGFRRMALRWLREQGRGM